MTGTQLDTLITSLNGGDSIESTLKQTLVNIAKATIEGERDWRPLRKTSTSLSLTSGTTWQTAYSLATITDFLRFQDLPFPVKVFDGNNITEYYRQVPWQDRLRYKDVNNTFVYDEANNRIYFNGTHSVYGTIYLDYIMDTEDVDLTSSAELNVEGSFPFPGRYHALLAFYAVGIHKGAVDYDEINKQMLPANQAAFVLLKNAFENWDTRKGMTEISASDPYRNDSDGFQSNHINMNS